MALNWAKLVEGKKVPNVQLDAERTAKEMQQRLMLEQEAPLRQRFSAMRAVEKEKEKEKGDADQRRKDELNAAYLADHTKERGYLGKEWTYGDCSAEIKLPNRLHVPRTVNEKAMSWIENVALPSWWEEWTAKCNTIGMLKQAFYNAFVPWLWRQERKGYYEFDTYERTLYVKPEYAVTMSIPERTKERERRAALPNAVRYKSMLDWVQLREKEAKAGGDVPYGNLFWVTCKNITFENCLRAMDISSETFRAFDKNGEIITGFLKVNGNPRLDDTAITWLADFSKYVPIPHFAKEKCAQAKAKNKTKAAEKERTDDEDDWMN